MPVGHLSVFVEKMCSPIFLIGLFFFFFGIEFCDLFIYLDINPLSVISFANIFSHSVGCL